MFCVSRESWIYYTVEHQVIRTVVFVLASAAVYALLRRFRR